MEFQTTVFITITFLLGCILNGIDNAKLVKEAAGVLFSPLLVVVLQLLFTLISVYFNAIEFLIFTWALLSLFLFINGILLIIRIAPIRLFTAGLTLIYIVLFSFASVLFAAVTENLV